MVISSAQRRVHPLGAFFFIGKCEARSDEKKNGAHRTDFCVSAMCPVLYCVNLFMLCKSQNSEQNAFLRVLQNRNLRLILVRKMLAGVLLRLFRDHF